MKNLLIFIVHHGIVRDEALISRIRNCLLIYAVNENNIKDVESLINDGADVNAADNDGWTPLHYASTKNKEIAQFLIDNGANVNAADNDGNSSLHYASASNNEEIVKLFINNEAKIDAVDKYGWTALHYAAAAESSSLVKYLLFEGASYHKKNNDNETAYDVARDSSSKEILQDEESIQKAIGQEREKVKQKVLGDKFKGNNLLNQLNNRQLTGKFGQQRMLLPASPNNESV